MEPVLEVRQGNNIDLESFSKVRPSDKIKLELDFEVKPSNYIKLEPVFEVKPSNNIKLEPVSEIWPSNSINLEPVHEVSISNNIKLEPVSEVRPSNNIDLDPVHEVRSSNNINLEPVSKTGCVHSSPKEILTEIPVFDEMASVKIELPEVYIDYPGQELKLSLKEHLFEDIDDIQRAVTSNLRAITQDNLQRSFEYLLDRATYCINVQGNYFE